jgi:hypothetical protein
MGGAMSGGHNRTHGTTTQTVKLDIFELGRGFLKGSKRMYCKWNNGASISIIRDDEHLMRLEYWYTDRKTGKREKIKQYVELSWQDGRFGGKYAYFLCPLCAKRVQFLYFEGKYFKCRKCGKLNYPSQQIAKGLDEAIFNLHKAANKISPALSEFTPFDLLKYKPSRPHGMHQRKFNKLMADFRQAQIEYNKYFIAEAISEFPHLKQRLEGGEPGE